MSVTTQMPRRRLLAATLIASANLLAPALTLTATTPAASAVSAASVAPAAAGVARQSPAGPLVVPTGNWTWYGYKLTRAETNQIASVSLWESTRGVASSRFIPLSRQLMQAFSVGWVLTARNARSMGQCLAINYAGTGLIVGC